MRTPVDPLRKDEASVRRSAAWRPIMGLFMLAAVIAITVVLTPTIANEAWIRLRPTGLTRDNWNLLIGFGTFMVLLLVFAGLFALGAPKSKPKVTESSLKVDRNRNRLEDEERREQQKRLRNKMSKSRREDQ